MKILFLVIMNNCIGMKPPFPRPGIKDRTVHLYIVYAAVTVSFVSQVQIRSKAKVNDRDTGNFLTSSAKSIPPQLYHNLWELWTKHLSRERLRKYKLLMNKTPNIAGFGNMFFILVYKTCLKLALSIRVSSMKAILLRE